MNDLAGWLAASNRASDGALGTTVSFESGTPSPRSRSPRASLTVMTALANRMAAASWARSIR